jgi:sugar lactone lactonase YvrE
VGVDRWGHIYVLDTGNHRIQKLSSTGRPLAAFGLGPNLWATDMAVDAWGHVYLSYYDHIVRLSPRGQQLAVWWRHGGPLAIDSAGNVYTVNFSEYDPASRRYYPFIDKLSPAGEQVARIRYTLGWLAGIAVNGSGDLYALDPYGHDINILSPSGRLIGRRNVQPDSYYGPTAPMVVDGAGTVYLGDPGRNRILKLSAAGIAVTLGGQAASRSGRTLDAPSSGGSALDLPEGVAADARGNVYVADTWNDRVQKLSPQGALLREWGSTGHRPGQFVRPTSVLVNRQGVVVVADLGNSRLQMFSLGGRLLRIVPIPGPHYIYNYGPYPSYYGPGAIDVALDTQGNFVVSDSTNRRVYRLSSTGRILQVFTQWVTQRDSVPAGVAVDSSDNVYVADSGAAHIVKLSASGRLVATWGRFGYVGPGRFNRPSGIAVDADGNVFVSDVGNHAIQELAPDGLPLRTWGTLGAGRGQFAYPQGIAIGRGGAVYVADTWNDRIQKMNA